MSKIGANTQNLPLLDQPIVKKITALIQFLFVLVLTFLGLLAITFFIGRVIPIDPVLAVVGDRATQELYDATRTAMGLDRPLFVQFFAYVGDVFTGDLGKSVSTGRFVADDLMRVFPATLEMATLGIFNWCRSRGADGRLLSSQRRQMA